MTRMDKLLFIGLNGLAGSGKDTVAKMVKTILSKDWKSLEECKEYYHQVYNNPTISATFNQYKKADDNSQVMCIAFADQLKYICASIFGLPVERFYNNKSNAWVCINKKFEYTEKAPNNIITAEEYYYRISELRNSSEQYWMSLREVLVYVGTYILQQDLNKNIFINIVRNTIREKSLMNENLKYVIVTDVRFTQEFEYIKNSNGIMIKIIRDGVKALNNIAEHDLDDEDNYDIIINNDKGYDELFEQVWNVLNENVLFNNNTINLYTRDNTPNYLRLIRTEVIDNINTDVYMLCSPNRIGGVSHTGGEISMIDPVGGPRIVVGQPIKGTGEYGLVPYKIEMNEVNDKFMIYIDKDYWNND